MYSKNDYRYYLENQLARSDDFLAHYGVKGMKWRKRKGPDQTSVDVGKILNLGVHPLKYGKDGMLRNASKTGKRNVLNDKARGVKRTKNTNVRKAQDHVNRKTKTKANMYTTQRKSSYGKDEYTHEITVKSAGSPAETTTVYGQKQKRADMKADKKMRRQAINEANPYHAYDKNKSLKSNIQANKAVMNKRKYKKKKAYAKVDKDYEGV